MEVIYKPSYNDNYYFNLNKKKMLEKLFGNNFGADMAANIITDMMKKMNEEHGTKSIVVSIDEKGEPVITQFSFLIPERFAQAKEVIDKLKDEKEQLLTINYGLTDQNNDLKEELLDAKAQIIMLTEEKRQEENDKGN